MYLMMHPGPKNLITDVSGVRVGNAHDETLKSGVTAFSADHSFIASYAVMGGAPGTRETDLLAPDKTVDKIDALVLSGGSAFGIDAASGVVDRLRSNGRGFTVGPYNVPIVPAAILFDLNNGGIKDWQENPYPYLGRLAFDDLSQEFDVGSIGAGFGAQCGMMKGGLGSASFQLQNGITVGALVAANPFGRVTDASGKHFWAAPFEVNDEFGGFGPPKGNGQAQSFDHTKLTSLTEGANTTIAIVATDAILTKAEAQRMATAAHDGFARAIVPSHLPLDGDLIFAAAMGRHKVPEGRLAFAEICHAGSLCVSRAIARGVYHARSYTGDTSVTWQSINKK
jgi:D-aminopeptidase